MMATIRGQFIRTKITQDLRNALQGHRLKRCFADSHRLLP